MPLRSTDEEITVSIFRVFQEELFFGRAMAQAVSHQLTNMEVWVQYQSSPCGICGEQSGTGTGFSNSTLVFVTHGPSTNGPSSFIHHHCYVKAGLHCSFWISH
jgi:hypothetical protein